MSYYYYQEFKHGVGQLLSNYGFVENLEVETIIDHDNDFIEISQPLPNDPDDPNVMIDSFYTH